MASAKKCYTAEDVLEQIFADDDSGDENCSVSSEDDNEEEVFNGANGETDEEEVNDEYHSVFLTYWSPGNILVIYNGQAAG